MLDDAVKAALEADCVVRVEQQRKLERSSVESVEGVRFENQVNDL